jgi:hypothetical protein
MKKLFIIATTLCVGMLAQFGVVNGQGAEGCCAGQVDPNCEYPSGPCVCECPYTRYTPQYYCTTRCYQEPYTVQKKCTRMVPQYYEVTKCRYVPQYYTVQCCRQVPENYCVEEVKYCTKQTKDWHVRYIPYTYTKRTCCDLNQCQQQPSGNACGPQGCGPQGCPARR